MSGKGTPFSTAMSATWKAGRDQVPVSACGKLSFCEAKPFAVSMIDQLSFLSGRDAGPAWTFQGSGIYPPFGKQPVARIAGARRAVRRWLTCDARKFAGEIGF